MARIVVVGGTGYAGAAIVAEAVQRGHDVVAVSRSAPVAPVEGATYVQGSALDADFVAQVIQGADAVVATTAARGDMADKQADAVRVLTDAAERAGARLVAIGGFSSLRPSEGAPRFIEGEVAEQYRTEALAGHAFLEALRASEAGLDYVFVSPAAKFGSWLPGERTGTYRLGGEVAILDAEGTSHLSGADLAVAVVDLIESGAHSREHVSVVN